MMTDLMIRKYIWALAFATVSLIAAPVAFSQPSDAGPQTADVAPLAPQAPEPVSQTVKKDDTISLDFKDAEIGTVLRVLSMKSGVNIVTGPDVKGLVTVRLDNVPWEKALEVILRTYDYVYEREGNIIRVTTRERMKLEPVETKTFILNYSKADEVQKAIQDILTERGRVKVAERTNMIVVTDIPTNLYRIGEVIKNIDKMTPQAFIDSKIVKTGVSNTDKLGIKWNVSASMSGASRPITAPFTTKTTGNAEGIGQNIRQFFPITGAAAGPNTADNRAFPIIDATQQNPTPSFEYGTLDFSNFTAILNLLETRINTKVISNPRITVLNNQTAKVQVGRQIPIPTFERNEQTGSMEVTGFNYRDTGVVLNVTPHINSAHEILVDLAPEVSSVGANQSFGVGQIQAPTFDTTKAATQLLISSGQTIAIGGLMTDETGIQEDKVPFFGDIPFVGKLFRSKNPSRADPSAGTSLPSTEKVETLFFVTVTMVDTEGQPTGQKATALNQSKGTQGSAQATDKNAAAGPSNTSQSAAPIVEETKSQQA